MTRLLKLFADVRALEIAHDREIMTGTEEKNIMLDYMDNRPIDKNIVCQEIGLICIGWIISQSKQSKNGDDSHSN